MPIQSCPYCHGSGMKKVHEQGEPVLGQPKTTYAGTTFMTCECCIYRLSTFTSAVPGLIYFPPEPPLIPNRLERILLRDAL
jgi:hypothetical protein